MGDTPALSPQQLEAVRLLLAGMTSKEAAAAVGVTTRTLYSWRARDEWKEHYNALVESRLRRVADKLDAELERRLEGIGELDPKLFLDYYTRLRPATSAGGGAHKQPTALLQVILAEQPQKLEVRREGDIAAIEAETDTIIDVESATED